MQSDSAVLERGRQDSWLGLWPYLRPHDHLYKKGPEQLFFPDIFLSCPCPLLSQMVGDCCFGFGASDSELTSPHKDMETGWLVAHVGATRFVFIHDSEGSSGSSGGSPL